MTGIATETDVYVLYYGDGTTHWKLDPALDGHEFILLCDRTSLSQFTSVAGEPDFAAMGIAVETKVPTAAEVFAADEYGNTVEADMSTIREPVSLLRHSDGIDLVAILCALGYEVAQ